MVVLQVFLVLQVFQLINCYPCFYFPIFYSWSGLSRVFLTGVLSGNWTVILKLLASLNSEYLQLCTLCNKTDKIIARNKKNHCFCFLFEIIWNSVFSGIELIPLHGVLEGREQLQTQVLIGRGAPDLFLGRTVIGHTCARPAHRRYRGPAVCCRAALNRCSV